jgi:hypothetical protein
MKRLFCILTFTLIIVITTKAQTAVYMCTETGAYGYAYGTSNALTQAYNNCINYGGKHPSLVLSSSSKGYGAIAQGTDEYGRNVVGASAGYSNLADAVARAKDECAQEGGYNIFLKDYWYDR